MSHLNRRGFMKTLLATAASATPAGVDFSERIAWLSPQTGTASASTNLENGDQQLRLSPVGAPLAFQNFVRVGNEWKPATLPGIPLVTGASFPLVTSYLRREGLTVACEGKATAEGLDRSEERRVGNECSNRLSEDD